MTYDNKSSADLEREVADQRDRVEARIGEIKDRLSPGQLLDEALSYTKHGGAHFASNFGTQISANPLPAALVGVGLAWLISSTASTASHGAESSDEQSVGEESYYPYARLASGGLKRVAHSPDEGGQWWSEFETSSGDRYKARSNEAGERKGHFTDGAGKMFSGFIDDAGNRVRDIRDEAGNALSHARSWTDHNWRDLRHRVSSGISGVATTARDAASDAVSGTRNLGKTVQQQSDQLSRQILGLFDQQPLVAGALAFAFGAAIGAALPHTAQEDELLGDQADKLRGKAAQQAGDLYEKGKGKAAELYDEASEQAGHIYNDVKEKVADITDGQGGSTSMSRH
jgi:ElaB/YqjD/DUF883 family membrane-anchored ribosome-binding protein